MKLIVSFLPQEAHLPIIDAINLGWTQDLDHSYVTGVVFPNIIQCEHKARVFIHVLKIKEHDINLIKLNAGIQCNNLHSNIPCKVLAPIIRNWTQGNIVF